MRNKLIAGVVAGALVVAGIGLGAALGAPTTVAAQEVTDEEQAPRPGTLLDSVLSDLVEDGTITQAQADAIKEAIEERRAELGPLWGPHRGHHFRGPRLVAGSHLATAAAVIGIEVDELREALAEGSTLAEVAEANGVATETLVSALVEDAYERIDQAVEDGKIDADQAETMKEHVAERIEEMVTEGPPAFGGRFGPGFGGGFGPGFGPPAEGAVSFEEMVQA